MSESNIVFESTKTVDLEPITAKNLSEKRLTDPQGVINHLILRKELWKSLAYNFERKYQSAVKDLERNTRIFKRKYKKEQDMKKRWKNICIGLTALTATMLVITAIMSTLTIINLIKTNPDSQYAPKVLTSGMVNKTPNRVLSSVLIYNGDKQGSGTVISKGENKSLILTAAHNFKGNVGGECWVYYPDGSYAKSTLISYDTTRDLALCSVDSSTVLQTSYVPKEMPRDYMSCVSYSNGEGPNLNDVKYNSLYRSTSNKVMWDVSLKKGGIWDGASGGGVFIGEACCGVTSQRDANFYVKENGICYLSKKMYVISHLEVNAFLNDNKDALSEYGDWTQKPIDYVYEIDKNSPPLWTPKPNVPLNLPDPRLIKIEEEVKEIKNNLNLESKNTKKLPSEIPNLEGELWQ